MERIVIQVDEGIGKIYHQLSVDRQLQIAEAISLLLKKAANDATEKNYQVLLNEFGQQAIANGLTPEILNNLLKKDG